MLFRSKDMATQSHRLKANFLYVDPTRELPNAKVQLHHISTVAKKQVEKGFLSGGAGLAHMVLLRNPH